MRDRGRRAGVAHRPDKCQRVDSKSADEIAEQLGVSRALIQHAKVLKRDAEPHVIAAVESGELGLTTERLPAHVDLAQYILSSNDRRDLTQGQRAMIAARMNLAKLANWGEIQKTARALKVDRHRVMEAIVIQTHAPDLGEQVSALVLPFSQALERARKLEHFQD